MIFDGYDIGEVPKRNIGGVNLSMKPQKVSAFMEMKDYLERFMKNSVGFTISGIDEVDEAKQTLGLTFKITDNSELDFNEIQPLIHMLICANEYSFHVDKASGTIYLTMKVTDIWRKHNG